MAGTPEELPTSDTALKFGRTALEDYKNGRWQQALAGFIEADRAMHSPVFGLYTARCLMNLGRWLDARAQLQDVANGEILEHAPVTWSQARDTAKAELAELVNDIPNVEIRLFGTIDSRVQVNLDAEPMPDEDVTSSYGFTRVQLDPGHHELQVLRKGRQIDSRSFDLKPGEAPRTIALGPYTQPPDVPSKAVIPRTQPTTPPAVAVAPVPVSGSQSPVVRTSAYVALGFGLLGTCVGTVTGILAWRERNAILENCDGVRCPNKYSPRLDRARLYGNLSTAAFTSAGVGFAAAGLIFYMAPSNSAKRSSLGIELSGRF